MRRKAWAWSAGNMPRPSPLKKQGTPSVDGGRRELVPRAVPVRVAPHQERRSLGARDQLGEARHGVGVGCRCGDAATLGDVALGRSEHVEREVEEDRTAVGAGGDLHGVVHLASRRPGVGDGGGQLRDRREDGHMVELLQRARSPSPRRRTTTEHDER